MASGNGSEGTWNPVEARALKLGPVWAALLYLCPHSTGVWELSLGLLGEAVAKLQVNKREPSKKYLKEQLASFEASGHLKLYSDGSIWLKDRWSYNTYRTLGQHKISARNYLKQFPLVLPDFIGHDTTYDIGHDTGSKSDVLPPVRERDKRKNITTPTQDPDIEAQRPEVVVAEPLPRLSDLEKKLPEQCSQAWDSFKRRVARQNGGEISMDRIVEILQHILDEAAKFKLDGPLLLQGFAAANRNGSIRPDYVVKTAIGIHEDTAAAKSEPVYDRKPVKSGEYVMPSAPGGKS